MKPLEIAKHSATIRLAIGLLSGLAGCVSSAEEDELEIESTESALVGGTDTNEQPAIGMITVGGQSCTASLISSRVILTAAHCFDYVATKSGLAPSGGFPSFSTSTNGVFAISRPSMPPLNFNILRFAVFSNGGIGEFDLAVAELDNDVSSSVATPLRIGTSPKLNDPVTYFGFGCNARTWNGSSLGQGAGAGQKRKLARPWKGYIGAYQSGNLQTPGTCKVDSGGPALNASGQIVAVMSGTPYTYFLGQFIDLNMSYGNPTSLAAYAWIDKFAAIYGNSDYCGTCEDVYLKSSGGYFVAAENGGGGAVNANRSAVSTWETFRIVDFGNNNIALQTMNGTFLSAEYCGGSGVNAGANRARQCEIFFIHGSRPYIGLETWDGGFFMSAVNGGNGPINAPYPWQLSWETFYMGNPGIPTGCETGSCEG